MKRDFSKEFKDLGVGELYQRFRHECSFPGSLEAIQYLITSKEIKENLSFSKTDDDGIGFRILNRGFVNACAGGYLNIVQYLLTSTELSENADIGYNEHLAIRVACEFGHLELVKYLLTSHELKEHSEIHARDDDAFISACRKEHLEVIKYLVIDRNITKTEYIKDYLRKNPNDIIEIMLKEKEVKDLKDRFEQELGSNELNKINRLKV